MTPAAPRRPRSEAAILSAAREICQEEGYGKLTMDAVAGRAGVGKQTIYRWWPSKGALALDVFLAALLDSVGDEPAGDIRSHFRVRLRTLAAHLSDEAIGPHIAGIIGEAQIEPRLADLLRERLVTPAREQHAELLRAAQRRGEILGSADVELVADLLFGPVWFRLLLTRRPMTSDFTDALVDSVLGAVTPDEHLTDGKKA